MVSARNFFKASSVLPAMLSGRRCAAVCKQQIEFPFDTGEQLAVLGARNALLVLLDFLAQRELERI
jgi:hypothetical protein